MLSQLDHLVVGTPDLEDGVAVIESLLGVPATPGGSHPGIGTRNALFGLGEECYLEVIGPDPAQTGFDGERPFGIDSLNTTRLVTWVARRAELRSFAQALRVQEIILTEPMQFSRQAPDGELLRWELAFLGGLEPGLMAVLPFFIDWGNTPNPAAKCSGGARLGGLDVYHPKSTEVAAILTALELNVESHQSPVPGFRAIIDGPNGKVELSTFL
ncbi:MAG: VOC family protein [Pseudomonadota bacterium]